VAIVALRVAIGLHFFSQGLEKLRDPKPFSAQFFGAAKGPFAPYFHRLVWDADGLWRLNDRETIRYWDNYRNQVVAHYGFDDKQKDAAKKTFDAYSGRLRYYLGSKGDEIDQYVKGLARRDQNAAERARSDLASLRSHDARIAAERSQLIAPVLTEIDKLWKDLESDLNAIATTEQWKRHGRIVIGKIGRQPLDSESVDRWIPYFDIAVGVCLVLGLFTRPAAILGGLFLASVCASQWPGSYGAAPIYPYLIEMLALFVLAAVGAGQVAGLDFLLIGLRRFCCRPKAATSGHR
jgi:uncharacterized membrane protein YphA (DoxX/SURF4 family)